MSDLELICWILASFYVHGCLYWVRPGALLFLSQIGERHRWQALHSRALLSNEHGGLLFGNCLPFGNSVQCQVWPISLSPTGVLSYVPQVLTPDGRPEHERRFFRFADMKTVTNDGRRVLVNGKRFATVCSAGLAGYIVTVIKRLADLEECKREGAITEILAAGFRRDEIRTRYRKAILHTIPLMLACAVLFGFLLVYLPLSVLNDWPIEFRQGLICYGLILSLVILAFQHAVAAALPPDVKAGKGVGFMLLSPADAIHARTHLFNDLLARYHPLAVAQVLCSKSAYEELARRACLDLQFPLPDPDTPEATDARETIEWFRTRMDAILADFLRQSGIDYEKAIQPPEREGPDCLAYCPRCRGQYTRSQGDCSTCRGMAVRGFDEPAPSARIFPPPPVPPPPPEPETSEKVPATVAAATLPSRDAVTTAPPQGKRRKRGKRKPR
jgi:hypothetical protein